MTIQTQTTDKDHAVIRARVDRATACFYPASQRIILVADKSDFAAAQAALDELRAHLGIECVCESPAAAWCDFHGKAV